jgi:exosortase
MTRESTISIFVKRDSIVAAGRSAGDWIKANPLAGLLLASCVATFVYFYGFLPLFVKGTFNQGACSVVAWAWQAWNPVMNQEHSKLVPFISAALIFYHRDKIRKATKRGSNSGLVWVAIGILLFVLSARCLQPRLALASVPFLVYGAVLFLWGKEVARIVLFPCAFLIFMIPVGAIEQGTFRLQFIITGVVGFLSNIVGIKIDALGTTLTAADNSFNFQIAEGCSGIRSLTAITMVTAIYVHLTQDRLWKKAFILAFSVVFAIIGNIGRVFTIILVAKFINPDLAAGIYHEASGFISFPIALAAMYAFSRLLNVDLKHVASVSREPEREPVTYDY